jgi:hypothetical protein
VVKAPEGRELDGGEHVAGVVEFGVGVPFHIRIPVRLDFMGV